MSVFIKSLLLISLLLLLPQFNLSTDDGESISTTFMVSLRKNQHRKFWGDDHICSGVIISPYAILTAAHCVVDSIGNIIDPSKIRVVSGVFNRIERSGGINVNEVDKIKVHGNYYGYTSDLAIVFLAQIFKMDNYRTIVPPAKSPPIVGENCFVLGWGEIYFTGPWTANPANFSTTIAALKICRDAYPKVGDGEICVWDKSTEGLHLCSSYAGSPLICGGKLTGILSYSINCDPMIPTIFTGTYYYKDWIAQNKALKLTVVELMFLLPMILHFRVFDLDKI